MAINKIEVDFNNKYEYDIADVNYSSCEVKINFDEEIEINMSSEQFVALKAKFDEVYKEMFGPYEEVEESQSDILQVMQQLEDLKNDCQDFVTIEPTINDVKALEVAIKVLRNTLVK